MSLVSSRLLRSSLWLLVSFDHVQVQIFCRANEIVAEGHGEVLRVHLRLLLMVGQSAQEETQIGEKRRMDLTEMRVNQLFQTSEFLRRMVFQSRTDLEKLIEGLERNDRFGQGLKVTLQERTDRGRRDGGIQLHGQATIVSLA